MRAGAEAGEAGDDHLVHERYGHLRLEELGGQVAAAGLLAGRVEDVDLRHHAPFVAGVLTAERIMTSPPLGPGTAPFTSSRLRSGSVRTISRFKIVTRAFPMCPDIRMPLNTRLGVAHAPMEPGERCLRCVPWLDPRPPNP